MDSFLFYLFVCPKDLLEKKVLVYDTRAIRVKQKGQECSINEILFRNNNDFMMVLKNSKKFCSDFQNFKRIKNILLPKIQNFEMR